MARILLEVKDELSDDDCYTMMSRSSSGDSEGSKKIVENPTIQRLEKVFHQLDDIVKPITPERREYLRSEMNELIDSIDSHDCNEEQNRAEEWARQNQEYQSNQERVSSRYGFVPKYREPRRWSPLSNLNPRNEHDIKTFAQREAAVNKIYDLVKDLDNVIYYRPNIRISRRPMYMHSRYVGSTSPGSSTSSRSRRDKGRRNYKPASLILHCSNCKILNRQLTNLRNGDSDEF